MSNNILRRPIHPVPGNFSIAQALRLTKLFQLLTTDAADAVPVFVDFSAETDIQGEAVPIPYMTFAERYPKPEGGQGMLKNQDATRYGIDVDGLMGATEGTDISLTSEKEDPNAPLKITMVLSFWPTGSPNHNILPNGVDSVTVDNPAAVLEQFDSDRVTHGAETAIRNLLTKPAASFGLNPDAKLASIKNRVLSPAMVERAFETLPGVLA